MSTDPNRNREPALQGVNVLDITEHMAGPYCTMILADLGADVIKIERPGHGDDSRNNRPFVEGISVANSMINRNKKSVTADLKDERGKEIVRKLAKRSDILVENHRPGVMQRLGLHYEAIREINPTIIYTAISGFGQTGPYSPRGGFDLIAQGMGGLMSVTGEPGRPPAKAGFPVADMGTGMWGAIGTLAALEARRRTGKGQLVDASLVETIIAWSPWEAAVYFATGEVPGPLGSAHRNAAPYQAFLCQDGVYINIGAGPQNLWLRLVEILGVPQLAQDPPFETMAKRHANLKELAPLLQGAFLKRPSAEWLAELEKAGIPAGPINTIDRVFADPHTLARDMLVEVEHAQIGTLKAIGVPVKLTDTPASVRFAAPVLGQHTDEVLHTLGYTDAELASLRQEGVI